jgi:hypothetical protein
MSDGETARPARFRMKALERLKRIREALAERDWLGITIEVLVVTLGVLIAIVAEQLVDDARWRREAREFRRAVDRDIAFGLAGYQLRLRQSDCIRRRIAELERWRDSWREGQPKHLTGEIGSVISAGMPTSAWSSRSGELMLHIPFEIRRDYGSVNDSLANYYQQLVGEREVWRSLSAFNGARRLNEDHLMRLNELLFRAKFYQRVLQGNAPRLMRRAAGLRIAPTFGNDPDMLRIERDPNRELCASVFEAS